MPLKLHAWTGFVLEQLLLVRFLLVFVVSCFSVTKSLRLANSFLDEDEWGFAWSVGSVVSFQACAVNTVN